MKIAIFNDFQLPIPAVKGGSVPSLTNIIIDENERKKEFEFVVYSEYDKTAAEESTKYKQTQFFFSKKARKTRFFTNLAFTVMRKLRLNANLSGIPLPSDVKKHFKSQHFDAVYINGYIRGFGGIAKHTSAPIIYQHHVVTDILNEKTVDGRELFDRCDKILFVSEFASNYAKTGKQKYDSKIKTFLNAIDTERFNTDNKDEIRAKIRKELGFGTDDVVILYVGRMVENKGCYEVIKAFNEAGFNNNVKLVIIGGATYSSKKVTPFVQKCFDEAKKNENITFCGYVPYGRIHEYYLAADISTLPSRCDEAAGLVGIESMAAGLPVITTNRGGIGEYVADGCKIVTPDDKDIVPNMSAAMKKLIESPDLRSKMGQRGIEISANFSKEAYYERFLKIIFEENIH